MFESVTPLKRETLQTLVHQRLCDLILQGEIAPGESITVGSIAKALDVSPMPVREAISRLMALGALTVVSGRSIGVPRLGLQELADLRRVRSEVEASAVRWAVQQRDAAFLAKLEEILCSMEAAEKAGQVREFIHANYDFHFAIYRQAGSPLLLEIIGNIWLRINPQFHLLQRHGHYRVSNRQHRALFDAISAGDEAVAVAALREDIGSAYEVILETLKDDSKD
ncbi:GntR family transcriptional regulator [Allosediminivita pacifica]|uniref:GntR family transcriptional regulator n=1 Tax=Allosediminivita pacifica TaxID=1267769 RepID=A0A2T6ATQ7_9RHOB|nr:GntR family transcriptional regulator [Allosediminivita pacifica]PTX47201.1 GntR family transcriptional regulator [Allosediminivita pacifica]GGB09466.1 GntR family transcriptional regulator [Allosediminivita pacifica]